MLSVASTSSFESFKFNSTLEFIEPVFKNWRLNVQVSFIAAAETTVVSDCCEENVLVVL